jgi:hypothetical protein
MMNMRDKSFSHPETSLEETQPGRKRTPDDSAERSSLEMMLHRARTAPDGDAALEHMQHAVELMPDDPRVQASVQMSVFQKLNSDAFLAFVAEMDKRYVISFRGSRPFSVPKARADQEAYPPARRSEAERALGMMWWMMLGLIPAGLGAMMLSPFALRHGILALQRAGTDAQEERMAWIAIFVTLVLALLGVFFAALLVIHLLLG